MEPFKISYLSWIKNIEALTHGRSDCYDITSSAVAEPSEILVKHIRQNGAIDLRHRIEEPNPWGQPRLIAGIAKTYDIDLNRVLVTNGASLALYLICRTFLTKGDQVIIEEPVYEPLLASPEAQGVQVKKLRRSATDNYAINLDELSEKMTSQTRLIILSNLHNPSGAWLSDESLMDILRIARKHNDKVKILVDEVFHDFVKDRQKPAATLDEAFISVNSLSKVYGLSILRIGWILASTDTINEIRQTYVLVENNGSRITEALASLVVENLEEFNDYSQRIISKNIQVAQEIINPLLHEGLMQGAISSDSSTYFPGLMGVADSSQFVQKLADKRQVFVVPGYFFAAQQHVRIGLGVDPSRLRKALELLADEILDIHRIH